MWQKKKWILSIKSIEILYFQLHVAIYYESLCSDSMDFLTNQFAPAYESLKDYMDVLFVPFGKAEVRFKWNLIDFFFFMWLLFMPNLLLPTFFFSYKEREQWTDFLLPTWSSWMHAKSIAIMCFGHIKWWSRC